MAVGPGGYGSASTAGPASAIRVRLAEAGPALEAHATQRVARTAPVTFSGPAPVRYFKSNELDERPVPVELPALVYPEAALAGRLRGIVRMRLFISQEGRVERAEVLEASSAQFERAATEAARQTRFRPGQKDGRAVPSEKLIEVAFDPYGQ